MTDGARAMMLDRNLALAFIAAEYERHAEARATHDIDAAWQALEAAHIVAQPWFAPHLGSHWRMLGFAISLGDGREAVGQLFRLALVPLGSLSGRLPQGNSGRARISAFAPMPLPDELAARIERWAKACAAPTFTLSEPGDR